MDVFVVILSKNIGARPCKHDPVIKEELISDDKVNIVLEVDEPAQEIITLHFVEGGEADRRHDHLLIDLPLLITFAVEFTHKIIFNYHSH